MRPVIAYDDDSNSPAPSNSIPLPKPGPSRTLQTQTMASPSYRGGNRPAPAKRQKREGGQFDKPHPSSSIQHWDDPGTSQDVLSYDEPTSVEHGDTRVVEEKEAEAEQEEEMSRHLTQEEIWDDSALINAWNAANEEYEAMHGPGKSWKKEKVHKSPLWYNTPPAPDPRVGAKSDQIINNRTSTSSTSQLNAVAQHVHNSNQPDQASQPTASENTHTLGASSYTAPYLYQYEPVPGEPEVSADEAFSRALSATYWAGYWTAWYYQAKSRSENYLGNGNTEEEGGNSSEGVDNHEDLVPAQR